MATHEYVSSDVTQTKVGFAHLHNHHERPQRNPETEPPTTSPSGITGPTDCFTQLSQYSVTHMSASYDFQMPKADNTIATHIFSLCNICARQDIYLTTKHWKFLLLFLQRKLVIKSTEPQPKPCNPFPTNYPLCACFLLGLKSSVSRAAL